MSDTLRQAYKRGFTLIELMIVIVILGILMGTILPRLTGAQGRARDTARVADLHNIQLALELYYNDYGQYPSNAETNNCLTETDVGIGSYLKNGVVPTPPKSGTTITCVDKYVYYPLADNQGYVLAAALETFQQENAVAAGETVITDSCTDPSDPGNSYACPGLPAEADTYDGTVAASVAKSKMLKEHSDPNKSVYAIIGAQ